MNNPEDEIKGTGPGERESMELAKEWRKSRLLNSDFTIICNNCCGGLIYRLLGCELLSPTIDLIIPNQDFFTFCRNLKYYLPRAVERLSDVELQQFPNADYPVGVIRGDNGMRDILIKFVHAKSFEEAVDKWNRRAKLVNHENIFILMDVGEDEDEKLLDAFHDLPYKNKCIFTCIKDKERWPEIFNFDYYTKSQFCYGYMFKFRWKDNMLTMVMDQFDFVEWLNSGRIQRCL